MLALRAARLFDGEHPRLVERPLVLVDEGRIVAVEGGGVSPPAAVEVVDLGDVTLLPGFVDVHVHLAFDASPQPVKQLQADDDATLLLRMRMHARTALRGGVTTVRDLGDRSYLAVTLREWFRLGAEVGPEILSAGPPLTLTGGHCHFMGGEADSELEVRRGVRERVKRGVDVIKIMATGGHMTPGTNPLLPQYTAAELAAAVEEAHRLGRRVTAHAHGVPGIARAAEAGMDGIEHCSFQTAQGVMPEPALIERLARQRIAVAPTIARPPDQPVSAAFAAQAEARWRLLEAMVKTGVLIVGGTDAGIAGVPHDSLTYATLRMAEAGMTNAQAVSAITAGSAEGAGLGERKGTLSPGKDADIVAVGGNPLADLACLRDVRAVYRAGVRAV